MKSVIWFVRGIPAALRKRFKAKCVTRDRTMQEVSRALLTLYIERPDLLEPFLQKKQPS